MAASRTWTRAKKGPNDPVGDWVSRWSSHRPANAHSHAAAAIWWLHRSDAEIWRAGESLRVVRLVLCSIRELHYLSSISKGLVLGDNVGVLIRRGREIEHV